MASLAIRGGVSAHILAGSSLNTSLKAIREVCSSRLDTNQTRKHVSQRPSRMPRIRRSCLRISSEDQMKMLDKQAMPGAEGESISINLGKRAVLSEDRGDVRETGSLQVSGDVDGDDDAGEKSGGEEEVRSIAEQLEDKYNSLRPDIQKLMEVKPDRLPSPIERRLKRRKEYWDAVSQRDDRPFFLAIALFVLVPPIAILGFAAVVGYVDFAP
eukprot:TRINITY_DN17354_c0_g2_i1.p2 TRINITY_DN17354_c0_g2~~TRINITY_DN17354_c0_g2_i1.p2  ORF type:complete len:213 (-),score=48.67 TRINITY_DN17354_c0_g2_i1:272-910(-)